MIQRHEYSIDGGKSVLLCMMGRRPVETASESVQFPCIIGTATIVGLNTDCPYIVAVHVDETRRRQGLGTVLVRSCVDEARRLFKPAVYIQVDQANTKAIELYERLGFEVVKNVRAFTGPTKLVMEYRLTLLFHHRPDADPETFRFPVNAERGYGVVG